MVRLRPKILDDESIEKLYSVLNRNLNVYDKKELGRIWKETQKRLR